MINRQQINCVIDKVSGMRKRYEALVYSPLSEPLPAGILETTDNLYTPPADGYRPIGVGGHWGRQWSYAWFRCEYTVPASLAGKELYFTQDTGAVECLIYINGRCCGQFDNSREQSPDERLHRTKLLTKCAAAGERFEIVLEGYNGHLEAGTQPEDEPQTDESRFDREYRGITVLQMDHTLFDFCLNLRIVSQLYRVLPDDNFQKGRIANALEQVFSLVPQRPVSEAPLADCLAGVEAADRVMREILAEKSGDDAPFAGLVGHSHLDTAWLWPMAETVRKAARTFSNALAMMELYPEYTFIASSPLHYEWMKRYYPDVFEGIRQRVAEGRWEPNGGSYVEVDCNITGGEMLIRQFIKGQRFTRENFGYTADTFWLPDTFGYSAAIPQLMRGCGMKYFITTKLSWNETNTFPYDTFRWRGVDGTEVLTHFSMIHLWPDPEGIKNNVYRYSRHKKITDRKLLAYGYGDGGGEPSKEMLEVSRRVGELCGLPRSEHTTVSAFMNRLAATAKDVPVYDGELYVELHRGTLTGQHRIKRLNRRIEFSLRNLETLSVLNTVLRGAARPDCIERLYDRFYPLQFHDILPGTSIARVHDEAIAEMTEIFASAERECAAALSCLTAGSDAVTVFNPLSFARSDVTVLDGAVSVKDHICQTYTDLNGNEKTAVLGVRIPAFGAVTLEYGPAKVGEIPFTVAGNTVVTPFARVRFNDNGEIDRLTDLESGRELRADGTLPINAFLCGDDIPAAWDNWDINADLKLKLKPCAKLLSRETVSVGAAELRIRSVYEIPRASTLTQDIVFYADTPQIDFETTVDWNEKHRLLKVALGTDVNTSSFRSEVQYGYLERATYRDNNEYEQAKFEVCNHKWTDFSENRFGVAILNDCKYGISVDGKQVALTLLKSGIRPDPRGDKGVHTFTYSLLPHNSGFGCGSVVKPAYALNNRGIVGNGRLKEELESLVTLSQDHILCEAVKYAEDNSGIVLRLYEAEKSGARCGVKVGFAFKRAYLTNMLEDPITEIAVGADGSFDLDFRAFEIKTVKFEL